MRFNEKDVESIKTESYEGGKVYKKDPLEDWMNFLFTSMMTDGFYETANKQQVRFQELTENIVEKYGAEFAAKTAVFARKELGMRSITHMTAALLNNKQFNNKRVFYKDICKRPDDATEIFAAVNMFGMKPSHGLVAGVGKYLSTLGEYQIQKYQMKGRKYNLYDLINITHAHSAAIDKYKQGQLVGGADTWENAISNATKETKAAEWTRLLHEDKLGYLALIRNLNNLLENISGSDIPLLCEKLTNEDAIRLSLVFPYQIYVAFKNLKYTNPQVIAALDTAFIYSTQNMPELPGKTALILDVSGSMEEKFGKTCLTIKETSAVYAIALLYHQNTRDIITYKFGNRAKMYQPVIADGPFENIKRYVENEDLGYGTEINSAFSCIDKLEIDFDQIFIFSDMQIMSTNSKGWFWDYRKDDKDVKTFQKYAEKHNPNCKCYSFDLSNYCTQVANPNDPNIYLLSSLSDKTFEMIKYLDNKDYLYNYINSLSFSD